MKHSYLEKIHSYFYPVNWCFFKGFLILPFCIILVRYLFNVIYKAFLLIVLSVGVASAHGAGLDEDSLLKIVQISPSNSPQRVNTLVTVALDYRDVSPDVSFQYAVRALNLALKIEYTSGQAKARAALAYSYKNAGAYKEALVQEQLAYSLAVSLQDTDLQVWCSHQIAYLFDELRVDLPHTQDSIRHYYNLLIPLIPAVKKSFSPDQSKADLLYDIFERIGGHYYNAGQYRTAIRYWLYTADDYHLSPFKKSQLWYDMAWGYKKLQQADSVLYCAQKIKLMYSANGLSIKSKQKSKAYHLLVLGAYYTMVGKVEKGIALQKKAITLLDPDDVGYRSDFCLEIIQSYEEHGRYDSAFAWQRRKLLYDEARLKNQRGDTRARTVLREAIQNTEANLAMADEQAVRSQRWLTASIVGLLVVAALAVVAVRSSRRHRRQNQVIADQKGVITQSLEQKETLLREIHHRVKNNLQVVNGLLYLQLSSVDDQEIQDAIQESQSRIEAMALIHQQLYQGEELDGVDLRQFGHELFQQVARLHAHLNPIVDNQLPNLTIDIDTATPLSLILNELLTNSFKHAFKHTPAPRITLSLEPEADGTYRLLYKDYGPGLPTSDLEAYDKSLGIVLINSLSKQIGGRFDYQPETRTFRVSFKGRSTTSNS